MDIETDAPLNALRNFMKQEKKVVTNDLRDIIKDIAKKGRYVYPWEYLKPLFSHELEQVMDNFLENFPPKNANGTDEDKVKELNNERITILKTFNSFTSAPFTIQRLAELVMQPRKHYKTCAKFFRGLHKNLLVVSTVDPEETDSIDPFASDSNESPAKRMRLEDEGEPRMETGNNGWLLLDQKETGSTDSNESAITNGLANETSLKEGSEMMNNGQEFDFPMQSTSVESSTPKDENLLQTDEQEPGSFKKSEQREECEVEHAKGSSTDCKQENDECKDEAEIRPPDTDQNVESKTDLSHIDTPL